MLAIHSGEGRNLRVSVCVVGEATIERVGRGVRYQFRVGTIDSPSKNC